MSQKNILDREIGAGKGSRPPRSEGAESSGPHDYFL